MRNEVKEAFLLGWENHLTYSSDYTNSMIGQILCNYCFYYVFLIVNDRLA